MARQGHTYKSRKVFPGKVISKLGAERQGGTSKHKAGKR